MADQPRYSTRQLEAWREIERRYTDGNSFTMEESDLLDFVFSWLNVDLVLANSDARKSASSVTLGAESS